MSLLLLVLLAACPGPDPEEACFAPASTWGEVVDMEGDPIPDARVVTDAGETRTDAAGRFLTSEGNGNRWVRVEAEGYLSRTRPTRPGDHVLVRLSEDDGQTLTLTVGGDTMFARRYQDPDEDGDLADAVVRPTHARTDAAALLADIAPLLSASDLTALTLEGPLILGAEPHPSKEHLFANPPEVAFALAEAGVDLVNLATSHTYDFLDEGVTRTLSTLEAAGMEGFGAGGNEEEAWGPRILIVGNHTLGLVACTTITGTAEDIGYDALPNRPGVAGCDVDKLRESVVNARIASDVVLVFLHGGWEYQEDPSTLVEDLATTAMEAGAHVVVGNHPHVIQAMEAQGTNLVAFSLGNLVFDQTLWDTLQSGLLTLEIGWNGKVKRATLEPLILEDFRPRGVSGRLQEQLARDYLGRTGTGVVVDDGAVEVDFSGRATEQDRVVHVQADGSGWSKPEGVEGSWIHDVTGAEDWRVGRDVLLVGDFEVVDLDSKCSEGVFWRMASEWAEIAPADDAGRLLRHTSTRHALDPTWSRPDHRLPLSAGAAYTLTGRLRGNGMLQIRLRTYETASSDLHYQEFEERVAKKEWQTFQIDTELPARATMLLPEFGLLPPTEGDNFIELDDLRLIRWEPPPEEGEDGHGRPLEERFDVVQVKGSGQVTARTRGLP